MRCKELGLLLKQYRASAKLTQAQVAAHCRVERSAVAHWERGRIPETKSLWRVVRLLNITPTIVVGLLGGADE